VLGRQLCDSLIEDAHVTSLSASIPAILAMALAMPAALAAPAGVEPTQVATADAEPAASPQASGAATSSSGRTASSGNSASAERSASELESRLQAAQRRLEAAQRRLETAAREVAELSAERGQVVMRRYSTFIDTRGRAIIGVQLDGGSDESGARVLDVSPGGPAAEAGIRAGDVITAVNGTEVKGGDAARRVVRLVRDLKPESKVRLTVSRNGKAQEFTVTARRGFPFFGPGQAGMPPAYPAPPAPAAPPAPPAFPFGPGSMPLFLGRGPLADMELATLTPRLGKYFGTDEGVLVVRAPADGALKLQDGDVILSIDGRMPTSGPHATRILGSYRPGEKIDLRIVRDRKRMNIETTMPERERRGPNRIYFRREERNLRSEERNFRSEERNAPRSPNSAVHRVIWQLG